jgi:hypothetical protein
MEGGYSAKQIFNSDKTGHFLKRKPYQTLISRDENKAPGFQVSKTVSCWLLVVMLRVT